MNYSKFIDHTNLKQDASINDIKTLCEEAIKFDFMSVCINPCFVKYAHDVLLDSEVKVCTVIGFPLGANTTKTKVYETKQALKDGADEIDMVINVSALKDKKYDYVKNEISKIKKVCKNKILKVILETCLLTDEEIVKACELSLEAKADFVKTSTGFSKGGATVEAVALMRKTVGDKCGVKASGGVKTFEDMQKMIDAGASRIGTSSGVKLLEK
ncbi:MAG: deoxyribose-phosphate aldolase [Firmicutes bacterium]|nr:deoxyribose-phosphate aldolase [Candidatus Alectryobacillus merdavium]